MVSRFPVLLTLAAIILGGCGGGGSGSGGGTTPPPSAGNPPTTPGPTFTASSGVAQKGPLILGSTVTVQELSATLTPTGKQYSYQTDSDFGTFDPNSTFTSQYIGVTATGYYFDEVTNSLSGGPISLQGYADLSAAPVLNVNLLTTLAYQRIQKLVSSGLTFAVAQTQAEAEVLAALNIPSSASIGRFGELDLSKSEEGDKILVAISSIFCQGNTAANLAALIANVQSDIGANGHLTSPATIATLAASAHALDPAIIASHLNEKYSSAGLALTASDIGNWLDHDGDAVVASAEFQVTDASPSSVFIFPADFVAKNAGAAVTVSIGSLSINGTPVTSAAEMGAGDVVTLSPPSGTFPDGVVTTYLMYGQIKMARVTFVSALNSIAITPADTSVPAGITQQLQATGTFSDGSTADLTATAQWQSSATAVASVASTGIAKALTVGSTTISASFGSISGSTTLNVTAPLLQSLTLSSPSAYLAPGVNRQLAATGHYSDGSTGNVTSAATWITGDTSIATVTGGLVIGAGLGTTSVTATFESLSASATLYIATEYWTLAAPGRGVMNHTATLLPNGKVLTVMGRPASHPLEYGSTDVTIYDPVTDSWSTAASTTAPVHDGHSATLLPDGRVLVLGGASGDPELITRANGALYDYVTNTWTPTPPMSHPRRSHTATLLADGRVLVAGGDGNFPIPVDGSRYYQDAEIYDPASDSWSPAGSLSMPRGHDESILLNNGKVLIVGGMANSGTLASAELYDPATNSWSSGGAMSVARTRVTLTKLPDGRVLAAGGTTSSVVRMDIAEVYDPVTNAWSPVASMTIPRSSHHAVLLNNGRVLVIAGNVSAATATYTSEIYDPTTDTWIAAPDLLGAYNKSGSTATLLPSGAVFVFGGSGSPGIAELYQ